MKWRCSSDVTSVTTFLSAPKSQEESKKKVTGDTNYPDGSFQSCQAVIQLIWRKGPSQNHASFLGQQQIRQTSWNVSTGATRTPGGSFQKKFGFHVNFQLEECPLLPPADSQIKQLRHFEWFLLPYLIPRPPRKVTFSLKISFPRLMVRLNDRNCRRKGRTWEKNRIGRNNGFRKMEKQCRTVTWFPKIPDRPLPSSRLPKANLSFSFSFLIPQPLTFPRGISNSRCFLPCWRRQERENPSPTRSAHVCMYIHIHSKRKLFILFMLHGLS